ncbi:hypothetical protein NXS19_008927 [Fusarium pseudograminearum]|nr:hypothetical protein NXS19_008927 [Fusarium pseudograminearum]
MRGLTQAAAAVLTPALVLAHGPHHPPPPPPPPPHMGFLPSALDVTPSAFVTLNVPWSDTEAYPLTLRFDVEESEEVCGPASIKLNGEPLNQDAKGHGVGSFLVNNETTISAEWAFECIGPKEFPFGQSMRFNVKALDDMAVNDESSFWMTFKQTAPIRISDVGNAAYVWSLSVPFSKENNTSTGDKPTADHPPPIWESTHRDFQDPEEELQVELMELEALHKQILQLEQLVEEREASVAKKLGKKYPPPPPRLTRRSRIAMESSAFCTLSRMVSDTLLIGSTITSLGILPHHLTMVLLTVLTMEMALTLALILLTTDLPIMDLPHLLPLTMAILSPSLEVILPLLTVLLALVILTMATPATTSSSRRWTSRASPRRASP